MPAAPTPSACADRQCHRFARPWLTAIMATMLAVGVASPARAASSDDEDEVADARLTGYDTNVSVGGGVALSYALVAFLGAISVGITFKNARRTHLD